MGVLYELSRVPGELGTHLALTGGTVGAHDAVLVGLADRVEGEAPAGDLAWQRDWIDECYAGDDPLAIVQRLAEHPDPQARATAEVLRQRCPFSVAVSLAAIRRAATLPDVASVLAQDLVLAVPMVLRPDFAEVSGPNWSTRTATRAGARPASKTSTPARWPHCSPTSARHSPRSRPTRPTRAAPCVSSF